MFNKMIVRKVILPVSSAAVFTASVSAATEEKKDEEKKELIRRKDLSIYPVKKEEKPPAKDGKGEEEKVESALMSAVREVREALWSVNKQVQDVSDAVNHVIETGKAHTSSAIEVLRDPDNQAQRFAAISAGGLVGYIIAIRRGWFRRLIYTGTGAGAVAAVAYPEEAKEYSAEGFRVAKKYIVIAYHFINGDNKQGNDSDKKDGKPNPSKSPKVKKEKEVKTEKQVDPQPASFVFPDSRHPTAEQESYYNMYSRRA